MGNSVIKIAEAKKAFGTWVHKALEFEITSIEICGRTLVPASPVKVELDYSFDGDAINAKGCISVSFHENCARCNNEFVMPFYCDFEERFFSSDYKGDEYPHNFTNEDKESFIYSGDTLDLYDFVYTTIVLNLPLYSLCSENCTGANNVKHIGSDELNPDSLGAKLLEALRKQKEEV